LDQDQIDREAGGWLVRAEDGGLSHDDRRAFEMWRNADVRNAATYDEMVRTWNEIPELGDLAELVPAPMLRDVDAKPVPARWHRYAAGGLAAIAAVLIAMLVLPTNLFERGQRYSTQVAEMRMVTLPDGSSVTLGAKSSIAVKFTDNERRVVLSGGQALFDVVHASRPFLVEAGGSVVRDIGTKFDLNLSSGTLRVSVLEGKVAVSRTGPSPIKERLLVAGQRAEVALVEADAPVAAAAAPPEIVALPGLAPGAWREGRLTYDNVRLADLVSDVNRYYAPGVELASPQVGDLRVTASFKTSEIPAFMSSLGSTLPVRTEAEGGGALKLSDAR
jgi:transmembrane sensor